MYLFLRKFFKVSHIPQRTEKDCLNCGTMVEGRYCQNCGQENVVPKETFWHMVTHFFYDITHFDSSFFETVKDLLFKPGFLSKEYMAGRRAKYLHPIRMYVFTSAVFFLLFFSIFKVASNITINADLPLEPDERAEAIAEMKEALKEDSTNKLLKQGLAILTDTSNRLSREEARKLLSDNYTMIKTGGRSYRTTREYDSIQALMPKEERDGWLGRRINKKVIQVNEKYSSNPDEAFKKLGESVLHRLPYMLFISLPLFALILRLVYIRHRKIFFFADHGVFTIHLYVFTFLLLMAVFGISELEDITGISDLDYVMVFLVLLLNYYLYRAMLNFYKQGKFKTFIKFLIVLLLSLVMMIVLFAFFLIFSAFTL